MHGPYQPLCVILTVCEQPSLSICVCHGPQLPCMHQLELPLLWVSFMPNTAPWSSLSPTELAKDVHFLCAHKATSKHTHNASPTSEGLTQARPIEHTLQFHAMCFGIQSAKAVHVQNPSHFGILLQVRAQYSHTFPVEVVWRLLPWRCVEMSEECEQDVISLTHSLSSTIWLMSLPPCLSYM